MNEYNNMYDSSATNSSASFDPAIFLAFMGFFALIALVSYAITALFLGMIFKKAGIPSWKAWIPIYNTWLLYEMGDQPGWWSVLAVVPFVNVVASIFLYIAMYHIGLRFGKDGVFVLLAIFLPIVWLIWLAVDKSTWMPAANSNNVNEIPNTPTPPNQTAAM